MKSEPESAHIIALGVRHLADDLRREAGCLDEPTQADFALGRPWLHPFQWLHWRKCRLCRRDVDELRAILAECRPMVSHPMPSKSGRDLVVGLGFAAAIGIVVVGIASVFHMVSPRPPQKGNSLAEGQTPVSEEDAREKTSIYFSGGAKDGLDASSDHSTPSDTPFDQSMPAQPPKPEATPVPSPPSTIADAPPPAAPGSVFKPEPVPAQRDAAKPPPLLTRATPVPSTPKPPIALAATPRPIAPQKTAPSPTTPESTPLFATSAIWQATADAGSSPDLKASVEVSVGGKRMGRATLRDVQPLLATGRRPIEIAPKEFFNLVFDHVSLKADPVLCVVDFSVSDRFYVVGLTSNRKFSGDIQFGNGWTMGRFELVTLIPNKDGELLRTVENNRKVSPKILDQLFVKAGRLFLIGPNDKDDSGVEVRFAPGAGRTGIAVSVTRLPNGR